MALDECRECGNEVSTEANSCPSCGAPYPSLSEAEAREKRRKRSEQAKQKDDDSGSGIGKKIGVGCLVLIGGWILVSVCFAAIGVNGTDTTTGGGSVGDFDTGPTAADVEIVSWNWRADPDFGTDGSVVWTAEVRSNATEAIESVRLELTTYDASGSVLTNAYTFVSGIPANGRKSTESYATYFGTEERARIQVTDVR